MTDIFVTGIGIISAIGYGTKETLDSIFLSKSGLTQTSILKTKHEYLTGEIKLSNNQLEKNYSNSVKNYSRTTTLGIIAAKQALENSGIKNINEYKTGLISATTVGGMDLTEKYYKTYKQNNFLDFIKYHHCGDSTEKIADYLNITDFTSTISTACSSSANSIIYGIRLLKAGILDRVIVGGTDALAKFTINGFNTLMILDKDKTKPFDKDRNGLNLGEGAAYLVLETKKTSKNPIAKISGYANLNDAHHQTASSPDGFGAYLAMKNAIKSANLTTSDINYINAHGTGTPNNDITESAAIKKLFGNNVPAFSSTKSFTGHTLGASASIEAVLSILALNYGFIYPNLNFKNPIPETGLIPETELKVGKKIKNVLSSSFGFGGNDSSLIFSKI